MNCAFHYDHEIKYYYYCCYYLIPQVSGIELSKNNNLYSSKHFHKDFPLLLVASLDEIAFSSWKTAFLSSSLLIGTWSGFLAVSSV